MSALWSLLFCLAPFALIALGYAWGRYGLPVEIRRRKSRDRRLTTPADDDDEAPIVYGYDTGVNP
ncbi:hypothetical protein [Candidatus Chloroploca asiatica]|uniref:Uncharacterized protein n=1 Tax=Candidatus Chloroploca asiatica TaxID=1506545 RepID=A0A2H3L3T1_9CHLR|nr:hypothetical protein [Candidatus Chloroploca asiatica]PDW01409.1 hypothetical protein A9Q02_20925 [Candidatus Chloroploca asiatica]